MAERTSPRRTRGPRLASPRPPIPNRPATHGGGAPGRRAAEAAPLAPASTASAVPAVLPPLALGGADPLSLEL